MPLDIPRRPSHKHEYVEGAMYVRHHWFPAPPTTPPFLREPDPIIIEEGIPYEKDPAPTLQPRSGPRHPRGSLEFPQLNLPRIPGIARAKILAFVFGLDQKGFDHCQEILQKLLNRKEEDAEKKRIKRLYLCEVCRKEED